MKHLNVEDFAEAVQQTVSRVTHVQSRYLVNPGRAGFARCWSKGLFRR